MTDNFTDEELKHEEWRPIPIRRYEKIYSVSDLGRVRRDRPASGTQAGRILKPKINKRRGRERTVGLSYRQKEQTCKIHILVTRAFLGPCPVGYEVNHKDTTNPLDTRGNNRLSNLEYVTHAQNLAHARKNGLKRRKLTREQEDTISHSQLTNRALASIYGVSHKHIGNIKNGCYEPHPG